MSETRGYNPEEDNKKKEDDDSDQKLTLKQGAKSVAAGVMAGLAAITAVEKATDYTGVQAEEDENRAEDSEDAEDRLRFESQVDEYTKLISRGRKKKEAKEKGLPETTVDLSKMGLNVDQLRDFPWKNHEYSDQGHGRTPQDIDSMTWTAVESNGIEDVYDQAIDDLGFEFDQHEGRVYFKSGSEYVNDDNDFEMMFWVDSITGDNGDVVEQKLVASMGEDGLSLLKSGPEGFHPADVRVAIRQAVQQNLIPHLVLMK
jgi:hypothetical protein